MRTLAARPVLLVALTAALGLLTAGGSLGYWLAVPTPLAPAPVAAVRPAQASLLPFTLEQLGTISGRLVRLESEAAQLSKRIGVLGKDSAPWPSRRPGKHEAAPASDAAGASGGPWLEPRSESVFDAAALDAKLALVERQIASVADAARQKTLELMRLPTRQPIADAELTSSFGNRSDPFSGRHAFHGGLDFAARAGTPIAAAAGGTVVFAGWKSDYGWVVELDHGNGLATRYGHASKLLVQTGQVVVPGEAVARVGSTGRSTGAHLHFEVLQAGAAVDPKRFLVGL